jgi:hypothetical protein
LVWQPLVGLWYQPQLMVLDVYGAFGGMRIGKGNQSIWRKTSSSATFSTTDPT